MNALTLAFDDVAQLRALFDEHLSKGRAFVPGSASVTERETCELVLAHGEREHRLVAEVVHVRQEDPGRGVGLQLAKLSTTDFAALRAFVEADAAPAADEGSDEAAEESADDRTPNSERAQGTASLHDRIHSLSGAEQQRLAGSGTLAERTALERMYGPTVWETLLRNARLTIPEVARIARKGSLPRPLVDLVAANAPWVASGEVQRALLANPRSSPAVVLKVLSAMSRRDLQLVPQQTAYPEAVRAAAKKRLGR